MLVTTIIPTVKGREDDLANCLAGLANQPYDQEVIVLRDRPTCGQAWVEGSAQSCGDYIWFAADDVYPEAGFFDAMIDAVDKGFCPAATVYEGDGLLQSAGIEGMDCYRPERVIDWMEVSHTATPFMSQNQWLLLAPHTGVMRELHYCSDMLHSAVMKKHGIQTVVRTPARLVHYNAMPGRGAGTDQHTRTATDRAVYERYCAEHLV